MNIFKDLKLSWKFSLLISGLMIIMGLLTIGFINDRMKVILHEELDDKAISIARNLAIDSIDPLLVDNRILLHQLLLNVYNNEKGIRYIFIEGPDNTILAHTFQDGFPTDLRNIKHPQSGEGPLHQTLQTEEGAIHHITYPILNGKGGYIHLGLNTSQHQKKITSISRELLEIVLIITLFGCLVAFLAGRLISRPLTALAIAVKFTGNGDSIPTLPVTSNDETGILTSRFNKMSEDLNTYITARDTAEKALKDSEALYRSLVDNIDLGIAYIDKNFNIIKTNAAQGKIFKRNMEDFIGRKCFMEFEKRNETCSHCPGVVAMKTGESFHSQREGTRQDGSRITALIRAFPVKDSDGDITGFIEVVEDITERIQMEDEISRAKHLETIGVLAGGIAHDFNNLMTGVFGNIELAKMMFDEPDKARERLNEAGKACSQAKNLTSQLLTFSKGGAPLREKISLPEFIEETCLAFLSGTGVRFNIHIPDTIREVMLDRSQMGRVIRAILENSCDALPTEGVISVTAANFSLSNDSSIPLPPGEYIELKFVDNGHGFPAHLTSKIFDPYFTTKEMGSHKGTGLGLSICHSIVTKHGGYIKARNHPSGGAEFTIFLPAYIEKTGQSTFNLPNKRTGATEEPSTEKARILVLEDEEVVTETISIMLERLHYDADFVTKGETAIQACRNAIDTENPYHMAIMDLAIDGGMGGLDAFKEIRQFAPDLKAIVSSGYTDDPVMADYKTYGFKASLPKPFSFEQLRKTIEALL